MIYTPAFPGQIILRDRGQPDRGRGVQLQIQVSLHAGIDLIYRKKIKHLLL